MLAGIAMRRTLRSKEGKLLQASSEVRPVPACLQGRGQTSLVAILPGLSHQVTEGHRVQSWQIHTPHARGH